MLQKIICCVLLLFLKTWSYGQAEVIPGLFTTYKENGRILWAIPEQMMGRDMSLTTTILKGADRKMKSADAKFGYAGDRFGPSIVRFEIEGDCVIVKQVGDYLSVNDRHPLKEMLKESVSPVGLQKFKILQRKNHSVVIDVTEWLHEGRLWGLRPFFFLLGIGAEQKSNVTDIIGLPDGVIVRSERVYDAAGPMPGTSAGGEITRWEIGCCLNLLPCNLMRVRQASSNVGFFAIPYLALDDTDKTSAEKIQVIKRWRLEIADCDTARYNRGELVEPCKPIVMYIDRNFPRKWWPYILKAVNNWNAVFERAGFKNAIEGRVAPDSAEYVLDNAALSWIVYKAGPMENAYGRPFIDFRTGEILSCHVAIFHSVFNMLCRWYVAQIGEEPDNLSDDIIGKLLEMVVTHEVGHTLGLTHNFYGSSLYHTHELKDSSLMKKYRHGSSIMDYMRLNYAVTGEDGLSVYDRIPQIGAYDSLAIEWGYRCFPGLSLNDERIELSTWLKEKQSERRYRFQDAAVVMPEAQAEDLGRVSLETAELGIKRLTTLGITEPDMERWGCGAWSVNDNRNQAVRDQYSEYINQALTYIGGRRKCWNVDTLLAVAVEKKEQKAALSFLRTYVLDENTRLPLKWREEWAKKVIADLVGRIKYVDESVRSGTSNYSVEEYLDDIRNILIKKNMTNTWDRFLLWHYTDCVANFIKNNSRQYPGMVALLGCNLWKMKSDLKKHKGVCWENWRNSINLIMGQR